MAWLCLSVKHHAAQREAPPQYFYWKSLENTRFQGFFHAILKIITATFSVLKNKKQNVFK
jgi:hypothetical protein